MKLLGLEFYKCRRRKIVLVCAAVLAAELLWFGVYLARQDAGDLVQGWMLLFYNLALIDAIFLPISVAALASRNCELEHKGASLKLLETMVTPGRLYGAKLAWGPWCWRRSWWSAPGSSLPWAPRPSSPVRSPGGSLPSLPLSPGQCP